MSNSFPLVIETLVALLLLFTIGYCFLLNRRLKLFKADEASLKTTISELMTATANAERAIAGLKTTVRDCEQGLGERLRTAERVAAEMDRQFETGENILRRSRGAPGGAEIASNPKSVAAAAQAFTERARSRLNGLAA